MEPTTTPGFAEPSYEDVANLTGKHPALRDALTKLSKTEPPREMARRIAGLLHKNGREIEADDVLQEIYLFLMLPETLSGWAPSDGPLGPYLFLVLRNNLYPLAGTIKVPTPRRRDPRDLALSKLAAARRLTAIEPGGSDEIRGSGQLGVTRDDAVVPDTSWSQIYEPQRSPEAVLEAAYEDEAWGDVGCAVKAGLFSELCPTLYEALRAGGSSRNLDIPLKDRKRVARNELRKFKRRTGISPDPAACKQLIARVCGRFGPRGPYKQLRAPPTWRDWTSFAWSGSPEQLQLEDLFTDSTDSHPLQ